MSIAREQVEELGRIAEYAKRAHRTAKQAFAEQECPFEVGQTVTVCGHTHNGKSMIIESIGPARFGRRADWQVFGYIVKANGEKGLVRAEFSQDQWEAAK